MFPIARRGLIGAIPCWIGCWSRRSSRSNRVERWETWFTRDAIPQIDGEARIAGPQRIAAAAILLAGGAHLADAGHGESTGALKPVGIAGALVELEESVAVASRAVTEVRALLQRTRGPDEISRFFQQGLERRMAERRLGKGENDASRAVTEVRALLQRTRGPDEISRFFQQGLERRMAERRLGKGENDARRAV